MGERTERAHGEEPEPGEWSHVEPGRPGPPGQDAPERRSRMVDVGAKRHTRRTALARARLSFPPGVLPELRAGGGPKGPIEEVARVAGILAAKRAGELIPMCHPLALDHVEVRFHVVPAEPAELAEEGADADVLEVRCRASCTGPTGVEMEALTGAAVAALTVYDMTKGRDKGIRITAVELLEKTGGKSGAWRSPALDG